MDVFKSLLLAGGILASALALRAAPPPVYPPSHFFKTPDRANLQLSPSGRYLAALAPRDGRANIFVVDRRDNKAWWATGEKDADIVTYFWKGDDTFVFTLGGLAKEAEDGGGLFSVGRDGRQGAVMVPSVRMRVGDLMSKTSEVLHHLSGEADAILIAYDDRIEGRPDVYRQRLGRQTRTVVVRNPGDVVKWFTDRAGVVRVRIRELEGGLAYAVVYRNGESEDWRDVAVNRHGEHGWLPAGFSADGSRMYVFSNVGRDKTALFEYDPATSKFGRLLYEDPEYDVGTAQVLDFFTNAGAQLLYSSDKGELVGLRYQADKPRTIWFREPYLGVQRDLDLALPGTVNLLSPAAAETQRDVVVRAVSDRDPGSFYLLNMGTLEMSKLASSMSWIQPEEMAPMNPISFTARDGRVIHGYLTLPPGREPKNLPLIFNPHGGPYGVRDTWGFKPDLQFLANRGFAVLQIDYRGSGGYGFEHYMAGRHQIGYAMLDDKIDAVRWAQSKGIADPQRTGIYGASYGGYATMAGMVYYPDIFSFGIDYVGVVDFQTQIDRLRQLQKQGTVAYNFWVYMAGDPTKDRAALAKISPINDLDKLRGPLMIVHGRIDPTVSIQQADDLRHGLDKRKLPYRVLIKNDEGHGFQKEENKIELYTAIDAFLHESLGDRYPSPH